MTGLDAVVEAELLEELDGGEVEAGLLELGELVVTEGDVFPKVVKMFPFEKKLGGVGWGKVCFKTMRLYNFPINSVFLSITV